MKYFRLLILSALSLPVFALDFVQIGRTSFIRDEENAFIGIKIKTSGKTEKLPENAVWNGVKAAVSKDGNLRLPVETRLFPGTYSGTLECNNQKHTFSYRIGPQLPDDMPVILWGCRGRHKELQELGFNRALYYYVLAEHPANLKCFDDAVADGFRYYGSVTTNGDRNLRKEYPVIGRDGKPVPHSVDASHPEVTRRMLDWIRNRTGLRSHPAAAGALLNSEIRAATAPSFVPRQREAYKKFSGKDIPAEANLKTGVPYQQLKNFPADRVVPDDFYILDYYRWFWRFGDGWNKLNSVMADALRKNASPGFICFYDPALRVAPLHGSGGNVDILNHWTYAYPEPCRIVSHIDGMLEMTRNSGQQVWAMTQIICYRSRTTSLKNKPDVLPDWVKKYPTAPFISIPPDNLQEAIWTMISRPVKGLLFHGQGSLMDLKPKKKIYYACTNDDTQKTMRQMMNDVVHPLAPVLKRLPEVPSQTAVLHSFSSATLAGRGTWGWGGWPDDLSLMMYYGGLNPRTIYEESILKNGLGGIKILALPHCDVLSESIVKAIKDFQKRGGIVIGDPDLCPAIVPQVMIPVFKRSGHADRVQANLYRDAWRLRRELRAFVPLESETDRPDLLRFERKWKNVSYYFVVNDKRTFGDYLGPWKMIMEKGVPNHGNLLVYKPAGAVYELSRGGKAAYSVDQSVTKIPLDFTTNDGRIFMILPSPIAKLELAMPREITQGKKFSITGKIFDQSGQLVQALLPVRFKITDGKGRELDGGPYGCALDGIWKFESICPINAEGKFQVLLEDRASGLKAQGTIKIRKVEK